MARAGLTILTLLSFWTFLIALVASAPIPSDLTRSPQHKADGESSDKLLTRSLAILLELEERGLGNTRQGHMKRELFPIIHSRSLDYEEYLKVRLFLCAQYHRKSDNEKVLKRELTTPLKHDKREDLQRRSIFSKLKHKLKHAFNKVKKGVSKIKHVAKAVGSGIKKAGRYIKHNAAKIGKLGLKMVAAAASAAGRVAKFIPGIGTAVSMGLKGFAMGANIASDQIHAHLGGVLGKISGGLDYVVSPMGTASKQLGGVGGIAAGLLGREY